MIQSLQDELAKLKKNEKDLLQEKQKLEQDNDTLETKERQLTASVQDLTKQLQEVMEENVCLQTEVDEFKTGNQESMQRMKDEMRDMKLELALVDRSKQSNTAALSNKLDQLMGEISQSEPTNNGKNSFMPSGSIDLVEDMLNLVKDMEMKLLKSKRTSTPTENHLHVEPATSQEEVY